MALGGLAAKGVGKQEKAQQGKLSRANSLGLQHENQEDAQEGRLNAQSQGLGMQ